MNSLFIRLRLLPQTSGLHGFQSWRLDHGIVVGYLFPDKLEVRTLLLRQLYFTYLQLKDRTTITLSVKLQYGLKISRLIAVSLVICPVVTKVAGQRYAPNHKPISPVIET